MVSVWNEGQEVGVGTNLILVPNVFRNVGKSRISGIVSFRTVEDEGDAEGVDKSSTGSTLESWELLGRASELVVRETSGRSRWSVNNVDVERRRNSGRCGRRRRSIIGRSSSSNSRRDR